jgi:hypothetical protein
MRQIQHDSARIASEDYITVYQTRDLEQAEPLRMSRTTLFEQIRYGGYRFWVSERRMPAAIVLASQVAEALMENPGTVLIGNLRHYGYVSIMDQAVPVIGREAYIDPLVTFL